MPCNLQKFLIRILSKLSPSSFLWYAPRGGLYFACEKGLGLPLERALCMPAERALCLPVERAWSASLGVPLRECLSGRACDRIVPLWEGLWSYRASLVGGLVILSCLSRRTGDLIVPLWWEGLSSYRALGEINVTSALDVVYGRRHIWYLMSYLVVVPISQPSMEIHNELTDNKAKIINTWLRA